MYPAEFEYFAPQTVDEVLELLTRYGEDAKILAGGQSLIPMMKLRIASPRYLIDVNRVSSLTGFRYSGDGFVFGALCRHAEIAESPLVREHLPIMADAANVTADVQVRNRGTLGGSLAHADPAGDWPTALLALDTEVTITGLQGVRRVPLTEFIVDAYTTQLGSAEMVTEVSVPLLATTVWRRLCEIRAKGRRLCGCQRGRPARAGRGRALRKSRREPGGARGRSQEGAGVRRAPARQDADCRPSRRSRAPASGRGPTVRGCKGHG